MQNLHSNNFAGGVLQSLSATNNLTLLHTDVTAPPLDAVYARQKTAYQVKSPSHLNTFRDSALHFFFPGQDFGWCRKTTRIGMLNRQETRRLEDVDDLVYELTIAFPQIEILIKEFEGLPVKDQAFFFSSVDILISPHGAQLTGIPFMPNCGQVMEVTPKGYHIPYFFGSLANASGLGHGSVYNSLGNPGEEQRMLSATKEQRW